VGADATAAAVFRAIPVTDAGAAPPASYAARLAVADMGDFALASSVATLAAVRAALACTAR
jgi:hypothetical protein